MKINHEITVVASTMIGIAILLQAVSIIWNTRKVSFLEHDLGSDFITFYVAGKTLNDFGSTRLYDVEFQQQLRSAIIPNMNNDTWLGYVYPPIVAALMAPLARLPYRWAFLGWLVIGGGLYASGLYLLQLRCRLNRRRLITALLLSVSFTPFLFEAWGGGQISVIAFAALAATLYFERSGKPFVAGLCAGLCCYKPSLILVPLVMVIASRLWRLLAGMVVMSGTLAAVSFSMLGIKGVVQYLVVIKLWKQCFAQDAFRFHKFVDLNTFFHLLCGGMWIGRMLFFVIGAGALFMAARIWMRYRSLSEEGRTLCWAGTMPLMLLVSFYAPVYDMTLLVLSGFLVATVIYKEGRAATAFERIVLVVYFAAMVSQPIALVTHIQLLTPILATCTGFVFSLIPKVLSPCTAASSDSVLARLRVPGRVQR